MVDVVEVIIPAPPVVNVELGPVGPTGPQGPAGTVAVGEGLLNEGTPSAAQLALDTAFLNSTIETVGDGRYAKLVGVSAQSIGRDKAFDPRTSAYNVTPSSFRRWNRAIADQAVGIAPARCNQYGDSLTYGSDDLPANPYRDTPAQLRKLLAARYGNAGTGVVYLIDHDSGSKPDPRITQTGTWVRAVTMGPYTYGTMRNATANSGTLVFAPEVPVDSFDIHLIALPGPAGGDFTVQVDGGAATTLSSANATPINRILTVSAGALGMHTLTINVPVGIDFYIYGFEGKAGTNTGVRLTRNAKGGAEASTLAGTSTAYNSTRVVSFEMAVPHLSIFEFGMNEYIQQRNPETVYKPNMQLLIDKARAVGSDILLVATVPRGGAALTIPQSEYTRVLYDLADENNLPLLDFQHRWDSYAVSNPLGYYNDITHPKAAGYYDRARALMEVISP